MIERNLKVRTFLVAIRSEFFVMSEWESEGERERERERERAQPVKVLIIKWCIQYWRDLWCVELLVDFDEYAHYTRFLWKTCKHCAYVIATKIQNIRLLFIWSPKAHCMIRLSVVIVNVSVAFISLKLYPIPNNKHSIFVLRYGRIFFLKSDYSINV